jgi:capsule polysaccharide export protein KpsE/RkpR
VKIEDVYKSVVEVEKLTSGILARVDALSKLLDDLNIGRKETAQGLNDFRLQCEKELVALKKDTDELRRWSERNGVADLKSQIDVLKEKVAKLEAALEKVGTRAWPVVPNVAGAIVNVVLAAVVAFIVSKLAK